MKWLNPRTGELERRSPGVLHSLTEDYDPFDPEVVRQQEKLAEESGSRMPSSVRGWLDKSRLARWGDLPYMRASSVGWRDVLTPRRVLQADGAQVLNTVSETIMCPDFTFAADYMEVGDAFKYTLLGDMSTQAAANNAIVRLRWGGVGGTALATSGSFAWDPTGAGTTLSMCFEFYVVVRSIGSAGSMFVMGKAVWNDFDDASATTLMNNLNMQMIPASAPAAVGSLDTTTAKALSPTVQFSSATATVQWTTHIALLESLN
jgi:hypothetical protein